MKQQILIIAMAVGGAALPLAQSRPETGTSGTSAAAHATVTLADPQGRRVGEASLRQTPHGILLKLELTDAKPGVHALHIHEVGRCERPSFESAGGHFAPVEREHGFLEARGPHAGDLPNIEVPATGQLSIEHLIKDVTLESGPRSLLDADGASVVMHAEPDDYTSQPSGDAGARIACGALVR